MHLRQTFFIIKFYLFADDFCQLVWIYGVDLVHEELEHEVPAPVAAAVTVDGKTHGIEDIVHLLHPSLLEDCSNRDLNLSQAWRES